MGSASQIQQRFADLKAQRTKFNNRLWEEIRRGNSQSALETHTRLIAEIQKEQDYFFEISYFAFQLR